MWTYQSEEGRRVHLLGSLHLARKEMYPLPDHIEERFDGSSVLVVEADVTRSAAATQQVILNRGMYPPGERLEENITPQTRALLESRGVNLQESGGMRPWLVAMSLQVRMLQTLGYEQQYGIDVHFLRKAAKRNMEIVELESIREQIDLFADLSDADEDRYLFYALTECGNMEQTAEDLFSAWRDGDIEYLEALIMKTYTDNPGLAPFFDALFRQRNLKMARTVEMLLRQPGEDVFMIVGAGHLVGPDGVVSLLGQKGFKSVRQ